MDVYLGKNAMWTGAPKNHIWVPKGRWTQRLGGWEEMGTEAVPFLTSRSGVSSRVVSAKATKTRVCRQVNMHSSAFTEPLLSATDRDISALTYRDGKVGASSWKFPPPSSHQQIRHNAGPITWSFCCGSIYHHRNTNNGAKRMGKILSHVKTSLARDLVHDHPMSHGHGTHAKGTPLAGVIFPQQVPRLAEACLVIRHARGNDRASDNTSRPQSSGSGQGALLLLTRRSRWPTVVSSSPSGWGWAARRGPPSIRSHPGTARETAASCRGISVEARRRGCRFRRSRHRPWCRPWSRLRRTWPGWACWRRDAAERPSVGARHRGSLCPDAPPARPRWSTTASMEDNKRRRQKERRWWRRKRNGRRWWSKRMRRRTVDG